MAKICQYKNGCPNAVFSHGFCKYHQGERTDEKYLKQFAKKNGFVYNEIGGIKSFTKPSKTFLSKRNRKPSGEAEMFLEIWNASTKRSFLSWQNLKKWEWDWSDEVDDPDRKRHPLFHNLFHHVLNKKNYSKFRLCKQNIVLLSPQEHLDIHSLGRDKLVAKYGEEKMKCYWDKEEELKTLYNQY